MKKAFLILFVLLIFACEKCGPVCYECCHIFYIDLFGMKTPIDTAYTIHEYPNKDIAPFEGYRTALDTFTTHITVWRIREYVECERIY